MSTWREQLRVRTRSDTLRDWVVGYYHYPTLVLLFVFAFWTRIVKWERFVRGGDVFFAGNDPYYHLRSTQYVVENWPATMPFDPWTNFSLGTSSAQFGTLFDQLIATAALILGLGSPSETFVELVFLFAPAIFGVLTLVPAFFIGRRLGGRFGGVISVAIVALAPGNLLVKGWVGTTDHQVAEALFQALAVLGVMVAISVAEQEKPVYEVVTDRAFGSLRRSLGWSVLAGAAIGAYLLVWPPGVLLLGILGLFFLVHLSAEYVRGRSPEHAGFAGAVALSTAGIVAMSTTNTLAISATSRSLLQPGLAFAVAFGCAFMAWLAREWDDRNLTRFGYPVAVFGLLGALALAMAVLLPDLFGYFVNQVLRVVGFSTSPTAGTIGEAQPLRNPGRLYDIYNLAIAGAMAGAVLILAKQVLDDEPRGEGLLIVVWMAFMVAAVFTQVRFLYYFTIPVAALNAAVVGRVMGYVGRVSSDDDIEGYQVMTVVAVIALLLVPMLLPVPAALARSEQKGPGGGVLGWDSSLDWVEGNTPTPGQYATPNSEPMEYLGTFDRTDDYDYPPGAYGILAWWDYGHWITSTGHRIPNANPFQQGSNHAARFLLAGEESAALAELQDRDEDDAQTRYVMLDWKMADMTNKGSAPVAFVDGISQPDFYSFLVDRNRWQSTGNFNQAILGVRHKASYYDSMVNRLYHYHGSAQEPEPFVVEWQGSERELTSGATFTFAPVENGSVGRVVQQFDTMQAAREYVAEAPEVRQLGGIGAYPTHRVPAVEHFRLVHMSRFSASQGGYPQALAQTSPTVPAWTKTFERVPGATIRGTGPANTNVTASVELQPNVGGAFTYTQRVQTDADGSFTMTVPYASTGYDEWGVDEGYTNTSVRATGQYQLTTPVEVDGDTASRYVGQVDVTEGQVLGEDDSAATVTLSEETSQAGTGGNATDGGNATAGTGSSGDTDAANGTDDTADSQGSLVDAAGQLASARGSP